MIQILTKKDRFGRTLELSRNARGQALIETAIASTILTLMVAIACNFAYLAYLNGTTSSAARQAAIHAIQGKQTPSGTPLPMLSSACAVAANEVDGWLALRDENWGASVASVPAGGTSWSQTTSCTGPGSTGAAFAADPESAYFGSTAVTVTAKYDMPIQFSLFGIGSIASNMIQTSHTFYVRQLN